MHSQRILAGGRGRLRRYRSRRVLTVWAALTAGVTGYVSLAVLYWGPLTPPLLGFLVVTPLVYGLAGVLVGGIALAASSRRPGLAFGASVLVGIAALSVTFGCPAVACEGVRRLRVFAEWTLLGPAVSASTDPGSCAHVCPHTVELLPLVAGYLLVGEAVAGDGG